ncbi:MAG: hypothetical protein P8N02_00220 [Actinomycetota bacterium]|nr:hypothetical protein [Actinomycetota bacterium]
MTVEIAPPSGTVTFLFTDIVGHSQMWEADRRVMGSAMARHDAITQDVVDEFDAAGRCRAVGDVR